MNIAVLGAGMVGRAIALDLAKAHDVTSFDLNAIHLEEIKKDNPAVSIVSCDLTAYKEYPNYLNSFEMVVTAVPGFMGYKTLEAVISAGKNVVDISFFPENIASLKTLAKKMNVTAVMDCGVAPGMSNIILGRYNEEMKVRSFRCYVGGLPVERKPPFQYKAPFSPVDVIQEYIRPVRLKEGGEIVTKDPLSDREMLLFDEVGELEAFNTDGLRSLVETMAHIPEMKEKTLRYHGHVDLIKAMQEAGFFDSTLLRFDSVDISPLEFTSSLLIRQWKLEPGEKEFTVMKVIVEGDERLVEYDLLDYYDPETNVSSMGRTTGYTCTAVVNLIEKGYFTEKGLFPPEYIGKDKASFDFILSYLKERGVNWRMQEHKKSVPKNA
jgi:lysine 6-dehydrogenase